MCFSSKPISTNHTSKRTASCKAQQGRSPSTPSAASNRQRRIDHNSELLQALVKQAQRDTLPWLTELLEPLASGRPEPLSGTVSPQQLADSDSCFAAIDGVSIHYKERVTDPSPVPVASGSTSSTSDEDGSGMRGASGLPAGIRVDAVTGTFTLPQQHLQHTDEEGVSMASTSGRTPMLLMHGFNGSTFNWRLVMDDLAAFTTPTLGSHIIAFDRPPFGLSQRPRTWQGDENNPYTVASGGRYGRGLLQRLGLGGQKSVLVGHSAGAPIALEMALSSPESVAGLVLIAPALSADSKGFLARVDFGQLLRFAYTRAILSDDALGTNYIRAQVLRRKAQVEAGQMGIYHDERVIPQDVIDGYLKPMQAHDWDWGSLQAARSFALSGPGPETYARVRVPVLVLTGADDKVVPAASSRSVAALFRKRGAGSVTEYVEIPRCGHLPMEETPHDVAQAMIDFVNEHCSGR